MQKPSYLDLVKQAPCILTDSLSLQRAERPCKIWCECLGLRLCGCDLVNFNVYQYRLPHFFHSMVATTLFFCPLLYNTIPAIHLYIESSSFSLCYHVSRPLGEFVFSCLPFCSYTLCFLFFFVAQSNRKRVPIPSSHYNHCIDVVTLTFHRFFEK